MAGGRLPAVTVGALRTLWLQDAAGPGRARWERDRPGPSQSWADRRAGVPPCPVVPDGPAVSHAYPEVP